MHHLKIDFLGNETERKARRTTTLIAVGFSVAVGLLAAIGAGASYRAAAHGTTVFEEVGNLPVIAEIRRLAWGSGSDTSIKTPDNRMTFLLLGIGGEGHDGAQLTDTILLASVDLTTKKIGIVSIPRDLAFPLGGGKFMKINAVNAYAEQSHPGNGARETANAFQELFGIRIDHVVRLDFKGFDMFIDALGGLDINVEHTFTDNLYPTDDFGPNPYQYQSITFKQGPEHMDGARALMYVRSRHGSNGEGSDFARSRRQQLVILAVKEKLLSRGTLMDPQRLMKLYEAIAKNLQSDLTAWDMVKLAPVAQGFSGDQIVTNVLTDDPTTGELTAANVEGSFMLFPKKQDWSQLRDITQNPFQTKEERSAVLKPETTVMVEIRNGTHVTGFENQVQSALVNSGYRVNNIGNAESRAYDRTVIYDLTGGTKPKELASLKKLLDANVSTASPASNGSTTTSNRVIVGGGMEKEYINATNTDFLIILGDSSLGLIGQ
jgi:polyisoprenyl-teichoic acid--peptidoglycan teichoic acid transferase